MRSVSNNAKIVLKTSCGAGVCALGHRDRVEGQTWVQPYPSTKVSSTSAHSIVLDREPGMKGLQRVGETFGEEGSGRKVVRRSPVTFYRPVEKNEGSDFKLIRMR